MRRIVLIAIALISLTESLVGCQKSPPPKNDADASAITTDITTTTPKTSATGARPSASANAITSAAEKSASPPLPLASDSLELVAVGKKFATKIVWLKVLGPRVWLSGMGLDAYADDDGALVAAPDLLAGLPHDLKNESIELTGVYPDLFVLRTKNVSTRSESPIPTVFIRKDGAWVASKPIGYEWYPAAFFAWNGGALFVTTQIQFNAGPYFSPEAPGTTLTFVAKDGSISHPNLGLDRHFMTWGGSSDGTTLSLIGTRGFESKSKDLALNSRGLLVIRGKDASSLHTSVLYPKLVADLETYRSKIREFGSGAVFQPPTMLAIDDGESDGGYEPSSKLFVVADGKPSARKFQSDGEFGQLEDVALIGDAVYALITSFGGAPPTLLRLGADGKKERVALPMIAKKDGGGFRVAKDGDVPFRCDPKHVVVRGVDDLWVQAQCGGDDETAAIAAVFRRGHAQEPILLP